MKKRLVILICGIGFLFLFTVFSYYIRHGALRNIDFAITIKLQEAIDTSPRLRLSRLVGEVMEGSTFFASPEVSVVAVLGTTVIVLYDWKRKKIRWGALIIPLIFFFLVTAEIFGKSVVHHPAPPFFMIKNPTTLFPKYYINEEFSYPSGHTARAVFIGLLLLFFILKKWNNETMKQFSNKAMKKRNLILIVVLGIYVGLVSISRIYLGHHWLSDVVGGVFLGGGFGLFTLSLIR